MNRIDNTFKNLKKENRKALISFISCSDPNIDETVDNVINIQKSGTDIIELGVPFSDPLADGPVIQDSYLRALKNGFKVKDIFTCGKKVRDKSEIPLVIMIYYNLIFSRGINKFIEEASESGFDAIIVPDIPLEERAELKAKCESVGIYLIPLVAPTSRKRIKSIVSESNGFVYCVSSNGTTGERSMLSEGVESYLEEVRKNTNIPICLGFGISSKEVVREIKDYCDGVIIGSAVVRRLHEDRESAFKFIKEIKNEI